MTPTPDEIARELTRLDDAAILAPQERALLHTIVQLTQAGRTADLYQKGLADNLGIQNAKQIGVLATRMREKLTQFYDGAPHGSALQIRLAERGYEARFVYTPVRRPLDNTALIQVANARAALDQRTLPSIETALRYLAAALATYPDHPLVLSLRAQAFALRGLYGVRPLDDLKAADALLATIAPASELPWEYWHATASVRMALHWDWTGAERAFSKAIALSNGEARFSAWHTAFLASQGRTQEAVEHLLLAVSRTPDSPIVRADLAVNQIYAGQYDAAEETIQSCFALFEARSHYLLYVHRAILHEARGDARKAARTIAEVPLKWPKTAITLGLRALFSGLSDQPRTARWHLSKLQGIRLLAGARVPSIHLAVAALGAGDTDAAVAWLRQASLVERDPNAVLITAYPFFRHLYGHPGFRDLVVNGMGLPTPKGLSAS